MRSVIRSLLTFLFRRVFVAKPIEAEVLALRHQVATLPARPGAKAKLSIWDRLLFVCLYRAHPDVLRSMMVVKPETVLRWHRAGFKLYWRTKSRGVVGRPRIPAEYRALIREMSAANPLWGAPRVHGELLKLGIEVAQSTVAKYMVKSPRPPSQTWLTLLRNHAGEIAALDLFVVPTLGFKLLYGLVMLWVDRRQIVHVAATYNPTAEWLARQVTEAFPWESAPGCLIRDRDASYGAAYRRRIRAMGIRDRPIAPRSPWQNGYAERVIGSIRRDLLDHVVPVNAAHLTKLLRRYASYYNRYCTHLALNKDTPRSRPVLRFGQVLAVLQLGGLHHAYLRT